MFRKIRSSLEKRGILRHYTPINISYRREVVLSMKRPVNLKQIEDSLGMKIDKASEKVVESLEEGISYLLGEKRRKDASNFFVAALRCLYKIDHEVATKFGLSTVHGIPDSRAVTTIVNHLHRINDYKHIPELLEYVAPSPWKVKISSSVLKQLNTNKPSVKTSKSVNNTNTRSQHFVPSMNPAQITRKYNTIKQLKIACILDNFSYSAYKFEADFLQLSVENYMVELKEFQPDLLFIESAWRGKDGLWGSKVGHADIEVIEILEWCQDNKIPTAFWNKEDPVHFKSFLNVAKLFNYVFTTDMDCIQRYKQALKHDRVYVLPFGFQPKLHNPVTEFNRINKVCFAGAYYKKYHERNRNMADILLGLQDEVDYDIYDRNFLEDNPEYTFPNEFTKSIVGTLNFDEINLAYKGYEIGLNLNTIKHSPTMFARRVFELLASNTLVFSNFSRGMKLLFGELVFMSDSGQQILQDYTVLSKNELARIKLFGIRNVFSQHTYEHRLHYIISKFSLQKPPLVSRRVLVISMIDSKEEGHSVISAFENQEYQDCSLIILKTNDFILTSKNSKIEILEIRELDAHFFEELMKDAEFLSVLCPISSYGPYFIQDLVHASMYIDRRAITKHVGFQDDESLITPEKLIYSKTESVNSCAMLIPKSMIMNKPVLPNLNTWKNRTEISFPGFVIDNDNFVHKDVSKDKWQFEKDEIDSGLSYSKLVQFSEQIMADEVSSEGQYFPSAQIYQQICDSNREKVSVDFSSGKTIIDSTLDQGEFTYLYWHEFMKPSDIGIEDNIAELYLDASPGLRMMLAVIFYDADKNKIGSNLSLANSNISFKLPEETKEIRLGLRVYQQGISEINSLDLFHRNLTPSKILTQERVLVVSNNYPSYDEKYRNGFLHSRLKEYMKKGMKVDMFVMKKGEQLTYREYEGIQVITGSQQALKNVLKEGAHEKIAVHFLDSNMWGVIEPFSSDRKILVWVHGSEIQPWHRRIFNYETEEELAKAKVESEVRMGLWRPLLSNMPQHMKLIFVSEYFANEVMEDTGVEIAPESYQIIHNPIDTSMFNFIEKPEAQRKKILSIRPFASNKYANDLTVKAILQLSKRKFFNELEFLIIGDGKLFDKTLEPLRGFENVTIQRGFLSHSEIAKLHKEYGIFLSPTRMDSQGVSRDEAMSSGLVAITNDVTAIPEFVDNESGVLVPGEDFKGMAKAIERIYHHPSEFLAISKSAAKRVRNQTDSELIIEKELKLLNDVIK
jgi:glycosyltransferase involved in cell wall biosynthesis